MPQPEINRPILRVSEAIFACTDVTETVKFYREKLGFQGEWFWGDPRTFGAALWGPVQLMFNQQPELAKRIEGHEHFFRCEDIDGLHALHQQRGAPIIFPIENKPWGIREYKVRDPNGYHLRFAGPVGYDRPATARSTMPEYIRIVERLPSVEEFRTLLDAVQWSCAETVMPRALANSIYGVVALDTRQNDRIVGMVRIIGDGVRAVTIQDVIVIPEFQGQRIGSAMMETAIAWLRKNGDTQTYVALSTPKPAFYERFGFQKNAGGMFLQL